MRGIKFRIYSKYSNGVIAKDDVTFEEVRGGNYKEPFLNGTVDVCQYTGLKDKNGKEIYEGEICKFYHHLNDRVVISYDEALLSFKATVVSDGIYCEDYFFINADSSKFEVIGNIYENPELLTN